MADFPLLYELVVVDDNYIHHRQQYKEAGEGLQRVLDDYAVLLREIVDERCIEGETAKSLARLAGTVSQSFGGLISNVLEVHDHEMQGFITAVDAADNEVY